MEKDTSVKKVIFIFQFEKLIGIMKQSMYKAIGNGQLRWYELEEVILDVEITLNNRPLGYVEDDI